MNSLHVTTNRNGVRLLSFRETKFMLLENIKLCPESFDVWSVRKKISLNLLIWWVTSRYALYTSARKFLNWRSLSVLEQMKLLSRIHHFYFFNMFATQYLLVNNVMESLKAWHLQLFVRSYKCVPQLRILCHIYFFQSLVTPFKHFKSSPRLRMVSFTLAKMLSPITRPSKNEHLLTLLWFQIDYLYLGTNKRTCRI